MRDRVLINTCILLLTFTIALAAQDNAAEVPLNNPFESFSGDTRHIDVRELKSSIVQWPKVETFPFVHHETTGITSYVIIRGKQKRIMFHADSDPLAVKSLNALNWRVFLPNSNGKKLFLVGQYFAEPKWTPYCKACATPEVYNEFRLIEWYIVAPFKVVREDCDNCPYMLEENLRTKRHLELSDFQDFEGRNSLDVRTFQREKRPQNLGARPSTH